MKTLVSIARNKMAFLPDAKDGEEQVARPVTELILVTDEPSFAANIGGMFPGVEEGGIARVPALETHRVLLTQEGAYKLVAYLMNVVLPELDPDWESVELERLGRADRQESRDISPAGTPEEGSSRCT